MVHSVTEERLYGAKLIDISLTSEDYQGGKLVHAHLESDEQRGDLRFLSRRSVDGIHDQCMPFHKSAQA